MFLIAKSLVDQRRARYLVKRIQRGQNGVSTASTPLMVRSASTGVSLTILDASAVDVVKGLPRILVKGIGEEGGEIEEFRFDAFALSVVKSAVSPLRRDHE